MTLAKKIKKLKLKSNENQMKIVYPSPGVYRLITRNLKLKKKRLNFTYFTCVEIAKFFWYCYSRKLPKNNTFRSTRRDIKILKKKTNKQNLNPKKIGLGESRLEILSLAGSPRTAKV